MKTRSILYLYSNPSPWDRVQEMTFSGIRRFAAMRGWSAVPWNEAGSEPLAGFLERHRPVAGCVVECSDDNAMLPLRLFGRIPVVRLHASSSSYGRGAARIDVDNSVVAAAAFRELSAVNLMNLMGRHPLRGAIFEPYGETLSAGCDF